MLVPDTLCAWKLHQLFYASLFFTTCLKPFFAANGPCVAVKHIGARRRVQAVASCAVLLFQSFDLSLFRRQRCVPRAADPKAARQDCFCFCSDLNAAMRINGSFSLVAFCSCAEWKHALQVAAGSLRLPQRSKLEGVKGCQTRA